jgi:glucose/arabinose dehydrogenase
MRLTPARISLAVLAVAIVAGAAVFGATRPRDPRLRTTVVQSGLEIPWAIAFAPDGRMLVTERPGRIRVYASAEPNAALLQTVEIPDVRAEGEAGAMGIAVGRDGPTAGLAYVCASLDADRVDGPAPWHNTLLRYRLADDGLAFEAVLFDEPMPAAVHHNGCTLAIDEAGYLWLTMGDGNIPAATVNPAQDPATLSGKILRLNADGTVPTDNPVLPGADGPTAAYTMGHRNPQGLAFGPDGLVIAAEHGTDTNDEVNRIVAGANYGWACYIGPGEPAQAFEVSAAAGCGDASAYTSSAWASGTPTLAISAATFLTGAAWGAWDGSLIVSALKDEDLRRFEVVEGGERLEPREVLLDGEFGPAAGGRHRSGRRSLRVHLERWGRRPDHPRRAGRRLGVRIQTLVYWAGGPSRCSSGEQRPAVCAFGAS